MLAEPLGSAEPRLKITGPMSRLLRSSTSSLALHRCSMQLYPTYQVVAAVVWRNVCVYTR